MIDALRTWIAAVGDPAWIAGAATAAAATWLLARLARRAGWVDDGGDAPHRKLQQVPVPLVGGAALVLGLAAAQCACALADRPGIFQGAKLEPLPGVLPEVRLGREAWIWAALLLAFGVGLIDDLARDGLRPWHKVLGQAAVGAVLAQSYAATSAAGSWVMLGVCVAAAVVSLNAVNTFDNADGTATSLGIVGLSVAMPACAAPLCGFLPFNLWLRPDARSRVAPGATAVDDESRARFSHTSPWAYLGDAGSHVIGVLLLLHPVATALLALPLLDLLRLCIVRTRGGLPVWRGDRNHIAHRFMRAGRSPTVVVLLLLLSSLPAWAGALRHHAGASPLLVWLGWIGVLAALAVAVRFTPSTD